MTLDRKDCDQGQKTKSEQLHRVPRCIHGHNPVLFSLFPNSSDVRCRSSRITVDQIAWPNRSAEVGGVWQMGTLVLGGKDCAMATWRNCCPGGVLFSVGGQCQCVFCVDNFDCIPRNVVSAKNIDYSHPAVIDFNSWNPVKADNQGHNKSNTRGGYRKDPKAFAQPCSYQRHQKNYRNHDSNDLPEPGSKDLHHTNLSLGATA